MRTIEVHFSDDAVRRGEVDDSNPRVRTLVATVRKLFGLGPIPLTLSCVVDGELFGSISFFSSCFLFQALTLVVTQHDPKE